MIHLQSQSHHQPTNAGQNGRFDPLTLFGQRLLAKTIKHDKGPRFMHTNILSYWQHLQNLPAGHRDKPSPRVCRLMLDMFEGWRGQSPFPPFGSFGHLRDHMGDDVMGENVHVRRGFAMQKTLEMVSDDWGWHNRYLRINPDEIIVGTMPPFSVGQGKEVMDYLKDARDDVDERLIHEVAFLNPWSNFGHICPNYQRLVDTGVGQMIEDCAARLDSASEDQAHFYQSVIIALEGVIRFANSFADKAKAQVKIARRVLDQHPNHLDRAIYEARIEGMAEVAERMRRIPAEPCESFTDAVQCIFIVNCALHWTGELTSLGRLDQILAPFLERDGITGEQAQEVLDCFWVKLDEQVVLDNQMMTDHFTEADGALMGAGGASNFDQGALANQWMQQCTLGGVIANDDATPQDACNPVTRMCLHAARKFPFNCPTVDLRVHKDTPQDVLDLAAEAMLSGGAHPILMNDDKLIPALHGAGDVSLSSARNYACDGCFETIFPGETEFSFIYIPGVDVLEKAMNSGAGFGMAGGTYLRGMKGSFRTPPADQIGSFEEFYKIMESHIWLNVNRQFSGLFNAYGCKAEVCPTPILSALIDGCIEKGRDMYNGGARYHMFAPLMTGISTVADSLYVIDKLVFQEQRFSLSELMACCRGNWGDATPAVGRKVSKERAQELRQICATQPKFGHGDADVDQYAWRLADSFNDAIKHALVHPMHEHELANLHQNFDSDAGAFNMVITPGVGTFEQYNFGGSFSGATPDGRKAFAPIASDLAASPLAQDAMPNPDDPIAPWTDKDKTIEVAPIRADLTASMASWNNPAIDRFADGAPSDFTIDEDTDPAALTAALRYFADGNGSNIMTVTTASLETMLKAEVKPLEYDLLRVRMGGWTEFFSVLFPEHKKQHIRRASYTV